MSIVFFRGMAIGFSIAAPVGPIGILCIHRTLTGGRVSGFVSGLGAATADACYGAVAAFGLDAIGRALAAHNIWIRAVGGLFLVYLGAKAFFAKPDGQTAGARSMTLWRDYVSTLGLTLSNPATILSFAAIFAGMGVGTAVGKSAPLAMVSGVFLGSAAWWIILSGGIGFLRDKAALSVIWINRLAGLVLAGFGVVVLLARF